MASRPLTAAIATITLAIAGAGVSYAAGASDQGARKSVRRSMPVPPKPSIGVFTPAAADPRLAAVLARGNMGASGFRFTPTEAKRNGGRAVTVAVRARSSRNAEQIGQVERSASATAPGLALTPTAYSLGVALGWQRFALSTDVSRVELAGRPGGREQVDVGVTYTGKRVAGRVRAAADRPLPNHVAVAEEDPSISLDLGGSYSLTRNLAVTAGVRYKSERDRLERLEDDRRDSQAVYVGTAFRF